MRNFTLLMLMPIILPMAACSDPSSTATANEASRLEKAGKPADAGEMAAQMVALRTSAILGDQAGVEARFKDMAEMHRRAIKLPDGSRPIDHEQARSVVRNIDGVRAVAWVDRGNLLVKVAGGSLRSQAMIDQICLSMQPLGDTLAVVVHLQIADARNHAELQTLSRNCQLEGEEQAFLQTRREMDVLPQSYRQQHARSSTTKPVVPDQAAINATLGDTPEM